MKKEKNQKKYDGERNSVNVIEGVLAAKPSTVWEFVSENEKPLSVLGVIIALLGFVQGAENKRIAAAVSVALIIASVTLAKSILDREKTTIKTIGCKIFTGSLEVSYVASIVYWGKAYIPDLVKIVPLIAGMVAVGYLREIAGMSIKLNGYTWKTILILILDVVLFLLVISLLINTISTFATK